MKQPRIPEKRKRLIGTVMWQCSGCGTASPKRLRHTVKDCISYSLYTVECVVLDHLHDRHKVETLNDRIAKKACPCGHAILKQIRKEWRR